MKDVLLVTIPALFTLIGGFLGSVLTFRLSALDRQKVEDLSARKAVGALTPLVQQKAAQLVSRDVNYFEGDVWATSPRRPLPLSPDNRKLLNEAQMALMVAGLPWATAASALSYVKAALEVDPAEYRKTEAWRSALRAQEALELLLLTLDRRRRSRRSRRLEARAYFMLSDVTVDEDGYLQINRVTPGREQQAYRPE